MTNRTELIKLLQVKASRGGFRQLDSSQQETLIRRTIQGDRRLTERVDLDIISADCLVWAASFGMIMLHEVKASDEVEFSRHVLAAENYLDLLLVGEESPGKIMDGYLILDLTHSDIALRFLVPQTEQNTRLVRKHCVWHLGGNWQRVDRISVLTLTDDTAYVETDLPPDLNEAGFSLIEALGEMTGRRLATLHASEWEEYHD